MKIDFRKIQVKGLHGEIEQKDLSEEIGNSMYHSTYNQLELELARDIACKKELDLTKGQAETIKQFVNEHFFAFVKEALVPSLQAVIDYESNKEVEGDMKNHSKNKK